LYLAAADVHCGDRLVRDSVFTDNSGGSIVSQSQTNPVIVNTTFSNSTASCCTSGDYGVHRCVDVMIDNTGNTCCPAKSFLTNEGICQTCSGELSCDNVGTSISSLKVAPGLWRASLATLTTLECYNTAACKGGVANSTVDDYCNTGYTGPCK
jgi:hypothetical protein